MGAKIWDLLEGLLKSFWQELPAKIGQRNKASGDTGWLIMMIYWFKTSVPVVYKNDFEWLKLVEGSDQGPRLGFSPEGLHI